MAISFDILGKDKASPAFDKVSKAAERTEKRFGFLAARTHGLTAGMTAGFGKIVGAMAAVATVEVFKGFIDDARESAKVGRLTEAVIKSTGGAAKISAKQVGDLATAISNKTGADDEAVQSGANLLLTFTNIRNGVGKGNDIFNQATQSITDMTAALNDGEVTAEGMKASSIQLGKALNDPIKGVTALQKVGVSFTAKQKEQIKTLVDSGKTMQAQKIILNELGKEFGGAAAAASDPLTRLGVVVGNVKETIGGAFLPIVDKAATWLGNNLPGAVDTAGRVFNEKLLPPLKAVAEFVKDKVIPVASGIVSTFTGLGSKLVKAVGKVDLSGIADDIWTGATGWAGKLINGWKSGLEKGNWKPLGKAIGDGLTQAVQNIGAGAGKLLDAVGGLLDKVDWSKLGGKISHGLLGLIHSVDWSKVGEALGDAVVTIFQKTKDLGQKVGAAFKAVIDKVDWKQIGRDSTNAIGQFITGIEWGRVAKVLAVAVLGSLKINATIYNSIIDSAGLLVQGMIDVILEKMEEGRQWIVQKTKELGGWLWAGLKSGIATGAKGVGNWLKTTFVDPVVNWAKSLFGIRSPSTVFATIGAQLIAGFKVGITGAVRGIGGWISRNVVSPAVAVFTNAGTWLVQQGKNFTAGFKSGVSTIAAGIGKWMSDHVIGPAVATFGKAGTWLYQAGKNVIAGFKNGMVEVWKDVTKWVGGIATWIKDHKGPVSLDATLLIPAGRAIMQGFLKGLKSGAGPAWSFVKSVGGKTVSELQAATGLLSGAGANIGQNAALGKIMATARGWTGSEWDALYTLWQHESGWNNNAQNPTSSAYGIAQFLDSTWSSVGASKTSDPAGQIAAGLKYIAQAYGDPLNAWAAWQSRSPHWYEKGTPWVPNDQLAFLHKGEAVIPADVNARRIRMPAGGGSVQITIAAGNSNPYTDFLIGELRKYIRVNGGDVQVVLGRG